MAVVKFLALLPQGLVKRLIHAASLVRSPYHIGVRVIVQDKEGAVLLVRHSYLKGWYLPGGGVDGGETMAQAARREIEEEAGVVSKQDPVLLNVFLDRKDFGRNHVGLFHITEWEQGATFLEPNSEIVEARFFALDALPDGMTGATARRLAEFTQNTASDGTW